MKKLKTNSKNKHLSQETWILWMGNFIIEKESSENYSIPGLEFQRWN
jgi:hypothetical protein